MEKNIKAVIFDLDGTLVDSMWIWKSIDMEFLGDRNRLPEDIDSFQGELEGMGFTETAYYFKEKFQLTESIEEIKRIWVQMAEEKYTKEVPLKPGVREFLEKLKQKGIPAGISSSNSRELIEAVLKAHHIDAYFSCITTCCEVPKGKPEPDVYLESAKKLGVKPEECLVFEDVPMGILAGKRAGMQVYAVEDDFSREQETKKREMADRYIQDYFELLEKDYE